MEVSINEDHIIQLEEVYNSIILKADKEEIAICMRDGGFEFKYNGDWYSINDGLVKKR